MTTRWRCITTGSTYLKTFFGEWHVVHGRGGKIGFNRHARDPREEAKPMRDVDWQRLVDHSARVLTWLGVESDAAISTAKQHLRTLRPQLPPSGKILQSGPQITGMSPTTIPAGTDSVVTLTGSNFGTSEGTVQLFALPNPDEWAELFDDEVLSWTDTLITFAPPSDLYGSSASGYSPFPSSGRVVIETTSSQTDTSSQVLNIKYNYVTRIWADSSIPMVYRMNSNGTADCTGEFAAVEAAFDTWQDIGRSYMTYERGPDTTLTTQAADGVNLVVWEDLGSDGPIARLRPWNYPITEVDITFNDYFNWTTSGQTGRFDVQNVATHEIGHTLLLGDLGQVPFSVET